MELLSDIHVFLLVRHAFIAHLIRKTLMLPAMYSEERERTAEEARAAFAGD